MIKTLILAVALVLGSVFGPESTLAGHSWICVDEFRQTTCQPHGDLDFKRIDLDQMHSAERFNSPFHLDCPDRRIMQMMDVSMARGSLNDLLVQNDRLEYTAPGATESDSLKLKDPNTAVYYALVPGFFVHGAGHFYAGKSRTALALFGVEILSIGSLYLGGLAGLPDGSNDNFTRQAVFLSIAAGLFFGSWYYDIVNAPQAVREHNKNLHKIK